ncbi:MAG: hypothetical protein RLZZ214_2558 [Verrucomicrobiota bacterium]
MTWLTLCLKLLLLSSVPGHAQVTADWVQGPGGVSVAGDGQGNVYTTRYDANSAGDIQLIKHNSNGVQQWQAGYDQTEPTKWEQAVWVSCDPSGNIVVCGTLMSGYSNPVTAASLLMKFSPAGDLLWRVVYDGDFDGSSTRRCLVDGNGIIYVLGLGMSPNGLVSRVKAFNPDGGVRWNWFDSQGIGAAQHFKFSPDRGILIYCRGVTGSINGYAKLDLAGNTVWSLTGIPSLTTGDLAGDSQGNSYILHGEYVSNGGTVLRKLDPAGATLWSVTHPFGGFRVEVGGDDLPVSCGYNPPTSGGAAFVKFNSSGGVIWQNLNADGSQNLLLHSQLLLDDRNNAYLAAGTLFQMAVCKVNSDGTDGWLYLGDGNTASAIAMGPAGRVYATGLNTVQLSQPYEALPAKLELEKVGDQHVISVGGEIGRTYRVEVSDDFVTWKPLVSVTLTTSRQNCVDPDSAGKPRRFYRVAPAD